MIRRLLIFSMLLSLLFLIGCTAEKFEEPDIKDEFCGVHINFQYCKCAFHDEFCDAIGMDRKTADIYVQASYDVWVAKLFAAWMQSCVDTGGYPEGKKCMRCNEGTSKDICGEKSYGVIELDGKVYINSRPGEVFSVVDDDLPEWARGQLVVVGAMAVCTGPPSTISEGDDSVLYNGLPVARLGDMTSHGGVITEGSDKIFINGVPAAYVGAMTVCPMVTALVPHVGGPISSTGY